MLNNKVVSPVLPLVVSVTVILELPKASSKVPLKDTFERAFFKAQLGAGVELPKTGKVFVSVRNNDKSQKLIKTAQILKSLNFEIVATKGTAKYLEENQIKSTLVNKVYEGRPNIVDMMKNGEIDLVMNTTDGSQAVEDSRSMRAECLSDGIPYYTTLSASSAAAIAIQKWCEGEIGVKSLQSH